MNSLTWAVTQTPSGAHGGSVSRAHGRGVRQVFVGPSCCHGLQGADPTNPNRASVLHRTPASAWNLHNPVVGQTADH